MTSKADNSASRPDDDNPEWTAKEFARARPASELLPRFIGTEATEALLKRGPGRPPKLDRKVNQTLRLDPDVLAAYRQDGPGWQAKINQVLREHMPGHGK